ncbi:MAG TPA: hypothetical protein VNX68_15500, partial [Nitrosopumilaceae archaeon]|nr:hypothetical protein [Nitrosopumilaceae archaeon]
TPEECNVFLKSGYCMPFAEMFIGIALLFNSGKRIAIPLAISMHLLILGLLGPTGHNYNPVIWGWNITMIFLVYNLFAGNPESKYHHFSYLFSFRPAYFIVILCAFLPALSLFNKWDSYLSSNLYSGNNNNGIIYMSDEAKTKLPIYLQAFTEAEDDNKYSLHIKNWAMNELGVPGYPEKRIFKTVEKYIKEITCCDDQITLTYKEKWNLLATK